MSAVEMSRSEQLFQLAQGVADGHTDFFVVNGPGVGDHNTNQFMTALRREAVATFGNDYSEKRICGENGLCVDFYFSEDATIVEVALRLMSTPSEFEKDILKAIMAQEEGHEVTSLVFISKPGAIRRCGQPGAMAIREWANRKHGVSISIFELNDRNAT